MSLKFKLGNFKLGSVFSQHRVYKLSLTYVCSRRLDRGERRQSFILMIEVHQQYKIYHVGARHTPVHMGIQDSSAPDQCTAALVGRRCWAKTIQVSAPGVHKTQKKKTTSPNRPHPPTPTTHHPNPITIQEHTDKGGAGTKNVRWAPLRHRRGDREKNFPLEENTPNDHYKLTKLLHTKNKQTFNHAFHKDSDNNDDEKNKKIYASMARIYGNDKTFRRDFSVSLQLTNLILY